jgi:hypothetical protein
MSKPTAIDNERRAIVARLSLCLLVAVALMAGIAAPASAEVRAPLLTGTEPESSASAPAQTTKPLIVGEAEPEVITQVVKSPFDRAAGPWAAGTKNPEFEIKIFIGPGCQGEPAATGLAHQLEEPGIQVTAGENTVTQFSAQQVDPSESGKPSKCSAALKYWEGNPPAEEEPPAGGENPGGGGGTPGGSPPPSPSRVASPLAPRLHTSPLSPANDNAPRLVGSAPGADAVKLFPNSSCSGAPVATVSPPELAAGVAMHVPDNSTTNFTGFSVGNGKQSFCSPPATYIEDSTAPRTRITMGPGAKTRRHKAIFRFADTSGDPAGVQFKCKVDRGKWKPCHSPLKLRHLSFHRYVLRVRGTDAIGNAEAKPAKRSFKVIH